MSKENDPGGGQPAGGPAPAHREVRYEYSLQLAPLLTQLGASLVVSTYQASSGNGTKAGDPNKLYFTAGPDDEQHGLFGRLELVTGSGR